MMRVKVSILCLLGFCGLRAMDKPRFVDMSITKATMESFIDAANKGDMGAIVKCAGFFEMAARKAPTRAIASNLLTTSIQFTKNAVAGQNEAQRELLLSRCQLNYYLLPADKRVSFFDDLYRFYKKLQTSRRSDFFERCYTDFNERFSIVGPPDQKSLGLACTIPDYNMFTPQHVDYFEKAGDEVDAIDACMFYKKSCECLMTSMFRGTAPADFKRIYTKFTELLVADERRVIFDNFREWFLQYKDHADEVFLLNFYTLCKKNTGLVWQQQRLLTNQGLACLQEAARKGSARALYLLGKRLKGKNATREQARLLFLEAANKGDKKAQFETGVMLLQAKQDEEGWQWIRKAATAPEAVEQAHLLIGVASLLKLQQESSTDKSVRKDALFHLKYCLDAKNAWVQDAAKEVLRSLNKLCNACRVKYGTFLCSGCRKARYCTIECQRNHYRRHKAQCTAQEHH